MCLMQYMHEVIVQITEQLLRHKAGGGGSCENKAL